MDNSSNEKYSIFMKKKDNTDNKKILSKEDILDSIPDIALKKENIDLQKTKRETRWRIFRLPNFENDIIEMSYKYPNEKRMYMSHKGEWIEYDQTNIYDNFIIAQYFLYT